MRDSAVGGNAVQVAVGEQSLFERGEGDQAFAESIGGFLQPVAFDGAVEDVVTVLVDDERHVELVQDRRGLFEGRAVVVGKAHIQRLAAADRGGEGSHGLFERVSESMW